MAGQEHGQDNGKGYGTASLSLDLDNLQPWTSEQQHLYGLQQQQQPWEAPFAAGINR